MTRKSRYRQAEVALAARSQKLAEFQRQLVSAERLAATITDYIDWRAFVYWVHLTVGVQGRVSESTKALLEARCPGFLKHAAACANDGEALWLRLSSWIDERIFGFANAEGWSHALGYYAARDPRSDQIENYWLRCDNEWKSNKPAGLPNFDDWRRAATAARAAPR